MLDKRAGAGIGWRERIARLLGRRAPAGSCARAERLIFIGGAPRSGTTLLQQMLDSHPAVFGGPEFDCIPAIAEAWWRVVGALEKGRITVYTTRAQIDAAFADLIKSLLLPAAAASGAPLLCEKTPFNVLVFSALLEILPCCRLIHLVRDPRAVIASMLNVGARARAKNETLPAFTQDLGEAIQFTLRCLDNGFYAANRCPQRVITLRYEDLVSQPEASARRICVFLNIPFDEAMLSPHERHHPGHEDVAKLDGGTWLDPALGVRSIETSRIDVWQRDLSDAQAAAVNAAFRDHPGLRELGYEFGPAGS